MPKLIKYYLDTEPIIPNIETCLCDNPTQQQHMLGNLDKLVVKAAEEAGGCGIPIGPHASQKECDRFAKLIKSNPPQ